MELKYKIITRYKNASNEVVSYDVLDSNGHTYNLPANVVISIAQSGGVANATLLKNNEFKTLSGEHINTLMSSDSLSLVTTKSSMLGEALNTINNDIDYFGKNHIKACRKIRMCASFDNFVVSVDKHKSNQGRNVHLFKLIESCGISVYDFVKCYLSTIQPYALEKFRESPDSDIWVCELGYKSALLIKIHNIDSKEPIVISFHESNFGGKNRTHKVDFTSKPCAVFVENVKRIPGGFVVGYIVQQGFIRYCEETCTQYYNDKTGIALIDYAELQNTIRNEIRLRVNKLADMYYEHEEFLAYYKANDIVDNFSMLSYGFATANSVIMLLDLYTTSTNKIERGIFLDIAYNLLMETESANRKFILEGLALKYENKNKFANNLIALFEGVN